MAEQQQGDANQVGFAYPNPPAFWKDFTPANVGRYETLKQEYAQQQGVDVASVIRLPALPPELTNLNPPAEPPNGEWNSFSEVLKLHHDLGDLGAAGIQCLVPAAESDRDGKHADRAFELKKLAKSLMLNYLELMGTMGTNPLQGKEKIDDLKTLFLNFHHTLNEYRPHQARESLIEVMQDQLDKKRAETAAVRGVIDRAKRIIEGLNSIHIEPPDKHHGQNGHGKENGTRVGRQAEDVQPAGPRWMLLESHFS